MRCAPAAYAKLMTRMSPRRCARKLRGSSGLCPGARRALPNARSVASATTFCCFVAAPALLITLLFAARSGTKAARCARPGESGTARVQRPAPTSSTPALTRAVLRRRRPSARRASLYRRAAQRRQGRPGPLVARERPRPGGLVATPGLTPQLEAGWYVSATTPFGDGVAPRSFSGSLVPLPGPAAKPAANTG